MCWQRSQGGEPRPTPRWPRLSGGGHLPRWVASGGASTLWNRGTCCVASRHTHVHHKTCDSLEVFVQREDVGRFTEEVRGDDPEVATRLRIEERPRHRDIYACLRPRTQ